MCTQTLGLQLSHDAYMHASLHIGTWEVEAHTAGPHLTVEAKAMRLEQAGGLRKQRSVWQDQAAAGEGALRLEAPLAPHTLLISLTPTGEAFAERWREGSLVTFGSPILSEPALLQAPSGGGQRLWPSPACPAVGLRVGCCSIKPSHQGYNGWSGYVRPWRLERCVPQTAESAHSHPPALEPHAASCPTLDLRLAPWEAVSQMFT